MLTQLNIRNFAVVENLEIDFDSGMTVLTGEAVAAKSIPLWAPCLVLRARWVKSDLGAGVERCTVSAESSIDDNEIV